MTEKVIFEYRAGQKMCCTAGQGGAIAIQLDGLCQPGPTPAAPGRARTRIGDALSFFERIYQDLYGQEE